jgi:phosphoacetylglucosamine mutase
MEVLYKPSLPPLSTLLSTIPPHPPTAPYYNYGTAGFRDLGTKLETVSQRIGIIATFRSISHQNLPIGIMVTASHNAVQDNGFKIIDTDGGMLAMDWEGTATRITNAGEGELEDIFKGNGDFLKCLAENCKNGGKNNNTEIVSLKTPPTLDLFERNASRPVILIGYDNRPSSPGLVRNIIDVCLNMGAIVINHGLVTTPQLHWIVGKMNDIWKDHLGKSRGVVGSGDKHDVCQNVDLGNENNSLNNQSKQITTVDDYCHTICNSFIELYTHVDDGDDSEPASVYVDVAYGVGYYAFEPVNQFIQKREIDQLDPDVKIPKITSILTPFDGVPVNQGAGIDYALKNKGNKLSQVIIDVLNTKQEEQNADRIEQDNYCGLLSKKSPKKSMVFSVDGDCDRVGGILTKYDGADKIVFLDGDHFIVLFVIFLKTILKKYQLDQLININIVQTAYCNGSSTIFVKNNFPDVGCLKACTGVKYLLQQTSLGDISIYFEPNGHGSIKFNNSLFEKINAEIVRITAVPPPSSENSVDISGPNPELLNLYNFLRFIESSRNVITPYIGDACGDILYALVALKSLNMTPNCVYNLFSPFQNTQIVIAVKDKSILIPDKTLAEERLLSPTGLQDHIDKAVFDWAQFNPRCFVRPSGTENVVRLFVESASEGANIDIIRRITESVIQFAGKP